MLFAFGSFEVCTDIYLYVRGRRRDVTMWRLTGEGTSEVYKRSLFMTCFVIPNWMSRGKESDKISGTVNLLQVNKE